jgi:hypothetical protein
MIFPVLAHGDGDIGSEHSGVGFTWAEYLHGPRGIGSAAPVTDP